MPALSATATATAAATETAVAAPAASGGAVEPTVAAAPMIAPPSVHVRAILTWLAIFPLVSIGMLAFAPLWGDWHPLLRSLLLTALVVPLAVYVVVPQLIAWRGAFLRRRSR